jgi:drug/metabolite transporter (DMT)-like permease
VTAAVLANSISTVLGRNINRKQTIEPVLITTISMGIGASALIALGLPIQGVPTLKPIHWIIIAWLAVVNTAFAFTLWNRTQRVLTAVESSIINNTMLIQTAILAWIFLAESLDVQEIIGLIFAAVGALIVQLKP